MYGFLPGFMYLGGLDNRLFISRKSIPSRRILKGSDTKKDHKAITPLVRYKINIANITKVSIWNDH